MRRVRGLAIMAADFNKPFYDAAAFLLAVNFYEAPRKHATTDTFIYYYYNIRTRAYIMVFTTTHTHTYTTPFGRSHNIIWYYYTAYTGCYAGVQFLATKISVNVYNVDECRKAKNDPWKILWHLPFHAWRSVFI